MRALKKALTLLMIMAAMLTAIFIAGRYGWKLGGYYAKEYDGKLCVGFRFSTVFGFFETGDFDITIPVKGVPKLMVSVDQYSPDD